MDVEGKGEPFKWLLLINETYSTSFTDQIMLDHSRGLNTSSTFSQWNLLRLSTFLQPATICLQSSRMELLGKPYNLIE